jgi:hypothetical protein
MFIVSSGTGGEKVSADPDEAPTGLRDLSSPYAGEIETPAPGGAGADDLDDPATRVSPPSGLEAARGGPIAGAAQDDFDAPPTHVTVGPDAGDPATRVSARDEDPATRVSPRDEDEPATHISAPGLAAAASPPVIEAPRPISHVGLEPLASASPSEPALPKQLTPQPTATAILVGHGLVPPFGDPAAGEGPTLPHDQAAFDATVRAIPDAPPAPYALPLAPEPPREPPHRPEPPLEPTARPPSLPIGALAAGGVIALLVVLGLGGAAAFYVKRASPKVAASSTSAADTSSRREAAGASHTDTGATSRPAPSTPPAPTTEPSGAASGSASTPVAPPAGDDEARARAALERMRQGIETCVSKKIHVLPGTSPAVPDAMAWLKHGPYEALKRDWVGPFFACTGFRIEEPMPFMIQWQIVRPKGDGTAVVWLDDDRDGKADRAFGLTAHWKEKDVVTFDAIVPLDPARPIAKH